MADKFFDREALKLGEILSIADRAIRRRPGVSKDLREIEAAIGALFVGQLFGWRVLEITHSYRTRLKYCKILGIDSFRDHCPVEGPETDRHKLLRAAKKVKNFWAAVRGENREIPHDLVLRKSEII